MRTLKFRAWDSKKKTFPMVGFDIMGECTVFDLVKQYRLEEHADLTIQQFTGFRDSDGKDIYEGDIVAWPDNPYITPREVLFDLQNGFWRISGDSYDGFDDLALSMNGGQPVGRQGYNGPIKVIGNIFENPELLKATPKDDDEEEDNEGSDDELDLESCEQCGEDAWDGYICHACGLKKI